MARASMSSSSCPAPTASHRSDAPFEPLAIGASACRIERGQVASIARQGRGRAEAHRRRRTSRRHDVFFHDLARGGLDTETDGFLVYVESDIVKGIHRVLRVSFLSRRFPRRPQHRSRSQNPSSFHLCIHTDGTFPILYVYAARKAILLGIAEAILRASRLSRQKRSQSGVF